MSDRTAGSVTARMAPERIRAAYQGSRRKPCDWWPHRSACTRLSATRAASSSRDAEGGEDPRAELPQRVRRDPCLGHDEPLVPLLYSVLYTVRHTTTPTESEDGDVQPGGPDGGAAGAAGGVPRRHDGERRGVGARRAGVPALRRLVGRGRPEPLLPLRALRRRRGLRGAQGVPALRAVADGRRAACSSARSTRPASCSPPTPPRSPHEHRVHPARPAVDGPAPRGDRALRPRQRRRHRPVRRQVELRGATGSPPG